MSVLEGGYDPPLLAECLLGYLGPMLGRKIKVPEETAPQKKVVDVIERLRRVLSPYWPCFDLRREER